jgi:hypothetical protein
MRNACEYIPNPSLFVDPKVGLPSGVVNSQYDSRASGMQIFEARCHTTGVIPNKRIHGVYTGLMSSNYTHVISFRVTAGECRRLRALRSTFPHQQWGEVMRWLLTQDDVCNVIDERLKNESQANPNTV